MSAVYPHEVRQQVATRIATALTVGSETLTPAEADDVYEQVRDTSRSPVHLQFAIGIVDVAPETTSRQKTAEGVHATADLRVLVCYQLSSPTDHVADKDTATALMGVIRNRLMARGWTDDFSLRWTRETCSSGIENWLWLELAFVATFTLPLA